MATTKPTPNKDSKFWIHPDDFQKVIDYAGASYSKFKAEIAGMMIVDTDDDGDFILKFPVIMKQTVSGGLCTLDKTDLSQYYASNATKYGQDVRFCWWHSHHTMKAFWSGTDDATILSMPSKDWTVSLVVNLKKEYKLRVQFFEPFLHEENIELNFLTLDSDVDDTILKEVEDKCTNEVTEAIYTRGNQTYLPIGAQTHAYDNSYAYDAYAVGTPYTPRNHYNTYTQKSVNYASVPDKIWQDATLALTGLLTEVGDLKSANNALHVWGQKIKPLNHILKKYNIAISDFNTPDQIDQALISYWDEDYFENITPVTEEIPF